MLTGGTRYGFGGGGKISIAQEMDLGVVKKFLVLIQEMDLGVVN